MTRPASPRPRKPPAPAAVRLTLPYPPSLNRMYRAVNGRSILSREGRAYRGRAHQLVQQTGYVAEGDVAVSLMFYRPRRCGDLDNCLKATMDALSGVAYRDDAQVQNIIAARFEDKANPRVEVQVTPLPAAPVSPGPAAGETRSDE